MMSRRGRRLVGWTGQRSERGGVGEGGGSLLLARFFSGLTQALTTSLTTGEPNGVTSKSLLGSSSSKALWWGGRSLVTRLGRPERGGAGASSLVELGGRAAGSGDRALLFLL